MVYFILTWTWMLKKKMNKKKGKPKEKNRSSEIRDRENNWYRRCFLFYFNEKNARIYVLSVE